MTTTEEHPSGLADDGTNLVRVKFDQEADNSGTDNRKPDNRAKHSRMSIFCRKCCDPMTTAKNPLPENPTICQRIRYTFLCPPHGIIGSYITTILIFLFLYTVFLSLYGRDALPGSNVFGLWVLFICSITGGYFVQFIRLPSLLGMLMMGIILKSIPSFDVVEKIDPRWSNILTNTALTVILIRAGLGLDPAALKKLSFAVVRLAFLPCITETLIDVLVSHFLLGLPWSWAFMLGIYQTLGLTSSFAWELCYPNAHLLMAPCHIVTVSNFSLGLPLSWAFMLGFVIAAVSPAVVVPCLLYLQDVGYGVDKGIPTLIIAAASIDDVLAITGFGVAMGISFSSGSIVWTVFKGPLEAILGVVAGGFFGFCLWYIPPVKQNNRIFLRGFILLAVGLTGVLGCPRLNIPGTGPLLCLTVAFVAAVGWRRQNDVECLDAIMNATSVLWLIFQPLLFGLIGAEVDVGKLKAKSIGNGFATLIAGLVLRTLVAFFAVFRTDLNLKEKFFVSLAWLPKATVQAALGSVALSMARERSMSILEVHGQTILETAVLTILVTAPVGAALIMLTGPRLLNRTDPNAPTLEKITEIELQSETEPATESTNMSL